MKGTVTRQTDPARTDCPDCSLTLQPPPGAPADCNWFCRRCGAVLRRPYPDSVQRTLALTWAALILFGVANFLPFLTFELNGRAQVNTLASGAIALWEQGMWVLGLVVLLTSVLLPLASLLGLIYLLTPLLWGARARAAERIHHLVREIKPWAMMEVYMIGVLVAYVKLAQMATVTPGIAFFAFGGVMLLDAAAKASLDPNLFAAADHAAPISAPTSGAEEETGIPESRNLERATAYLLAAVICYAPANLLPIMTVIRFGQGHPDTILSGVEMLLESGMWPLALVVFFASILVPVLKILALGLLLLSIKGKWRRWRRERTVLYRVTESVGRWSMIDIFMISILVALVRLDAVATVEPGPGALFFAAVVALTMQAAHQLDPRSIWK